MTAPRHDRRGRTASHSTGHGGESPWTRDDMPQSSPTIAPPAGTSGKIKNAAEKKQQRILYASENQTARSTLLERRHLVQAYTWQGVPFTTALTRFTLGFHSRLERLWEWETLIPKVTPLPQKSHFAIHCTSHPNDYFISAPIRALVYDSRLFPKMQAFFCNFFEFEKDVDIPPKAGIMKDMM